MREREEEDLLEDVSSDESTAAEDDAPIVILPDDIDLEQEFAGEPEPAPVPIPVSPPPAPRSRLPAPAATPRPAVVKRVRKVHPQAPPGADLTLTEIEEEVDKELGVDQEPVRGLFSMPRFCRIGAVISIALLVLLVVVGWDYYRLPLVVRPLHYFHGLLRPSGTLGLALGLLGALVMLSSLSYLARKGLVSWQIGPLSSWMGFHILTGLLGPAIAAFHAAFVPTSALGLLAFVSMVIVVGSGIVGRYIAVYFPRSLEGRELKLEEIRARVAIYRKRLADLGVDATAFGIDAPSSRPRAPWLPTSIARVLYGDWETRREFRRLRDVVRSKAEPRIQTELVLFLIRRLCWERQWLVRYGEFRRLVDTWRFLHRWLAVLLFVAVFFHAVVGLRFGELWILGGR